MARLRDHGGNLDWAVGQYGGQAENWVDLSTGINRSPYPLPKLSRSAWLQLPTEGSIIALHDAARAAFKSSSPILALAGAQAAIQLLPRIVSPGQVRVLGPTYNEHAAAFRAAGLNVEEVTTFEALVGADIAVVVNPNNPDGSVHGRDTLLELSTTVGRLVVDESFIDPTPGLSLAPEAQAAGLLVLRSFGKFYGLAGLRLGFVLGPQEVISLLTELAGPWPISGAAIEIGCAALRDGDWAMKTAARLVVDSQRLDALAQQAGWSQAGGTTLFRLYETSDSLQAQTMLARHHIWSRAFPWSKHLLRLGLPGNEREWNRLGTALES
mgnify:FL=1